MIETARLVLRELAADDAPFILELLNDPDFLRFVGDRKVRSLDDARRYIETGPVESYRRHGFGLLLVAAKPEGTPLGICGLLKREALHDVDVGFAFLPRFRGQGYAYESAAAVLADARGRLGLPRIVAITSPENQASIGLLQRLGFAFEGPVRLSPESSELSLFALSGEAARAKVTGWRASS